MTMRALMAMLFLLLAAGGEALQAQDASGAAAKRDSTAADSAASQPFKYQMNVSAKNEMYEASGIDDRRPKRTTLLDISGSAANGEVDIRWDAHFSTEDLTAKQAVDNLRFTAAWINVGHVAVGDLLPRFSEFSLNGVTVRGAETVIDRDFFHLHLLGGITQRAAEGDTLYGTSGSYLRYLAGARLLLGTEKGVLAGVAVTKAKDDVHSINYAGITRPQESLIGTLLFNANVKDQFKWTNEVNISGHTRDLRSPEYKEPKSILGMPVFETLLSSRISYAIQSAIDLRARNLALTGLFRRVQPGYTSLGSIRTDNDYQELSLDGRYSLFKRLISARTYISHRTDNLDGSKFLTSTLVRGMQTGFVNFSRSLSLSFAYSLFVSRDANAGSGATRDTLAYARNGLTHSLSLSPSYSFGSAYFFNRIYGMIALNILRNGAGADVQLDYDNYNLMLLYACNIGPSFGASVSNSNVRMLQSVTGETINTTELILEPSLFRDLVRLRLRGSFSYTDERSLLSRHWEAGAGIDYNINPGERLSLQLRQTWHNPRQEGGFSEFRWWLNYIHDIF